MMTRHPLDIASELVASPEGCTVSANHGHPVPRSGYVVAIPTGVCTKDLAVVAAFVADHLAEVEFHAARFFGAWTDPNTGVIYVDQVEIIFNLTDALETADARNELAIYDLSSQTTIEI